MRLIKLVISSIIYYRKLNVVLVCGIAVTSTIITGSLLLGDSVRRSLLKIAQQRTGKVEWVLNTGSHFFNSSLTETLRKRLKTGVSSAIMLPGIATAHGGRRRIANTTVIGVEPEFFTLSPQAKQISIDQGYALINKKVADILNVKVGDEFTLRIRKPSFLPSDAPFSTGNNIFSMRLKTQAIIESNDFGNFTLTSNPEVPVNIFVSHADLSKYLNRPDTSNVLLISLTADAKLTRTDVNHAINSLWRIEDSNIKIIDVPDRDLFEIRTDQVFLSHTLTGLIRTEFPDAEPVFSYFVNEIRHNGRSTPYSIVSTLPANTLDRLDDSEIIINSWLADDLDAHKGDVIELEYYIIDAKRDLQTRKEKFIVRSVVPITGWADDKTLMPDFPGLHESDDCKDWRPGIPVDLDRIRTKDEDYWDAYRGTPKAFISFQKAHGMWSNQFGSATGFRMSLRNKKNVITRLNKRLMPELFGIRIEHIKSTQKQSAEDSIDFSQLFLGLSFFIVISSLILTMLMFSYYVDQRSSEIGTLYALGYKKSVIRTLYMLEGLFLAVIGSMTGAGLSILYTAGILKALTTVWYDAVRTTVLEIHVDPATLVTGCLLSVLFSLCAIGLCMNSLFKKTITETQKKSKQSNKNVPAPVRYQILNAGIFAAIIAGLVYIVVSQKQYPPLVFIVFGIGMLMNGSFLVYIIFNKLDSGKRRLAESPLFLSLSNINRKPKHSLGIISMVAISVFMLVAVSANRKNVFTDASLRSSGTGGFKFFCTTTYPLNHDLNTADGKKAVGLSEEEFKGVRFVHLRLHKGDDASCLNITRTYAPQILGVDGSQFSKRGAFTFSKILSGFEKKNSNLWDMLEQKLPGERIPAVADQTVIQWGLGKKIGDTIAMRDETGTLIKLQLVAGLSNSILQGYIIIAEKYILQHFPSSSGYHVFLTDGIHAVNSTRIKGELERALVNLGVEVTPAGERLAEFNSVQNTYLSIFLMLGGFGLILGIIGLGLMLLKNVVERKAELSLLFAVGYTRNLILKILVSEYLFLLIPGICIGIIAGGLSVLPVVIVPGTDIPYALMFFMIGCITLTGSVSIYCAGVYSLKGNLITGLRGE